MRNNFTLGNIQGIKPECLDKVGSKEIRQIIEGCTKAKMDERYADCTIVYYAIALIKIL